MSKIILIETSAALCSTALAIDGRIAAERISTEPRSHASMTAVFIKEILDECGLKAADCDAVAVSAGPGSYTGLRVGSSTAKGICFATGLPLIAVSTLELLCQQAFEEGNVPEGCKYIVPMIDARRMEVYSAKYPVESFPEGASEAEAVIVDAQSYSDILAEGAVLFTGDGAGKCEGTIVSPNARFAPSAPLARYMLKPAERALELGKFENTAYFEPFYLKQFTATVSKKKWL